MRSATFRTPSFYSLYYELEGNPKSTDKILLVTGYASDLTKWGDQPSRIVSGCSTVYNRRVEVCSFDIRGCRNSTNNICTHYSTRGMARDIFALLNHLGWLKNKALHIVGWSLGGMIVQELVLSILEKYGSLLTLRSVTLCNTSSGGLTGLVRMNRSETGTQSRFKALFEKLLLPVKPRWIPSLEGIMRILSISLSWRVSTRIKETLKLHFSPQFLAEGNNSSRLFDEYLRGSPFDRSAIAYFPMLAGCSLAVATHYISTKRLEKLAKRNLPILIVCSKEDPLVPYEGSVHLKKILKCDLHCFLRTGHMSHMEHPITFSAVLCRHICSATAYSNIIISLPTTNSTTANSTINNSPDTPSLSPKSQPFSLEETFSLLGSHDGFLEKKEAKTRLSASWPVLPFTSDNISETIPEKNTKPTTAFTDDIDMSLWSEAGKLHRTVAYGVFMVCLVIPILIFTAFLWASAIIGVLCIIFPPLIFTVLIIFFCAGIFKRTLEFVTDFKTDQLYGFKNHGKTLSDNVIFSYSGTNLKSLAQRNSQKDD